jgi:general secretion pathway protein B
MRGVAAWSPVWKAGSASSLAAVFFQDRFTHKFVFDMSLILEALKKSEAKRQLGEAPGLGTPFTVARRRRSPLPVIVLLILVAAGVGWYYLRTTPAPAPDESGASKPSPAATSVAADHNPPAAAAVAAAPPNAARAMNRLNPPTASPRTPAAGEQSPLPQMAAQGGPLGVRADPRVRGAFNPQGAARPEGDAPRLAQRFAHPPSGPVNGAPNPATGDATFPRAPNATAPAAAMVQPAAQQLPAQPAMTQAPIHTAAATQAAPVTAAPKVIAPPSPAPAGVGQPAPVLAPATAKAAPDLPMYYELPFNVRKDLPALNVSMHVYAVIPEQRFVVIDGERKSEGEVIKEGLTLREIRTDGIVLDLRGQRFFYPRPGR